MEKERKRSNKGIKKLMCMLLAVDLTVTLIPCGFAWPDSARADDTADTRTKVLAIEATSSDINTIFGYGKEITKPTFTITEGAPARVSSSMGDWCKKNADGTFARVDSGRFSEGTWIYKVQVRIDGESGTTHVLDGATTFKLNGQQWQADDGEPNISEKFSWNWYYSPEMTIGEKVTLENGTADYALAAEGRTVTIKANAAPSGMMFDKWVVESGAKVEFADATKAETTFTMPAEAVNIKATYKDIPKEDPGAGNKPSAGDNPIEGTNPGSGNNPGTDPGDPGITQKPDPVKPGTTYAVGNLKYKVTNADMSGKGTVTFTGSKQSKTKATSVNIPDTVKINNATFKVTAVSDKAFMNYKKLKKVTIGKNVKTIGKNAFYGCKSLKPVTVKSTKLSKIGKNAFKNIYKKAKFYVPKAKYDKYKNFLSLQQDLKNRL